MQSTPLLFLTWEFMWLTLTSNWLCCHVCPGTFLILLSYLPRAGITDIATTFGCVPLTLARPNNFNKSLGLTVRLPQEASGRYLITWCHIKSVGCILSHKNLKILKAHTNTSTPFLSSCMGSQWFLKIYCQIRKKQHTPGLDNDKSRNPTFVFPEF